MTYEEALHFLADDPHAWRYRQLTADDHPDVEVRDAWRCKVVRMASGTPPANEVIPGLGAMPDVQGESIPWTPGCGSC